MNNKEAQLSYLRAGGTAYCGAAAAVSLDCGNPIMATCLELPGKPRSHYPATPPPAVHGVRGVHGQSDTRAHMPESVAAQLRPCVAATN
ncbi:hypothetical protein J6590_018502 [Homalodisca vitripennis]|nr:hypothetical protein J6590_018502 [Homalodisca vitripennis]